MINIEREAIILKQATNRINVRNTYPISFSTFMMLKISCCCSKRSLTKNFWPTNDWISCLASAISVPCLSLMANEEISPGFSNIFWANARGHNTYSLSYCFWLTLKTLPEEYKTSWLKFCVGSIILIVSPCRGVYISKGDAKSVVILSDNATLIPGTA